MNIILIIILLIIVFILIWALMGGRTSALEETEGDSLQQEATFRRRASDKKIEREYPDERTPRRRKSDLATESPSETDEAAAPFALPYPAEEIIPDTSQFRIYRRTLLNSEVYAGRGDYAIAISLYEGVKSRIRDVKTREKIDANIEYLTQYKKRKEDEARKKEEQAKRGMLGEQSQPGGEIKIMLGGSFPESININSLPETIHIGVIDPTKNLNIEALEKTITQNFRKDIADIRSDIDRIKGMPPAEAAAAQAKLIEALAGVKAGLDRIQAARGPLRSEDIDTIKQEGTAAAKDDALARQREAADSLAEIKNEFSDLTGKLNKTLSSSLAAPERASALAAAFEATHPSGGISRGEGPPSGSIPAATGFTREERVKRRTEADEGDEFELLSEYGKEQTGEEPSDEEIFAKILSDDRKEKAKEDFEILGEKKEARNDLIASAEERTLQQMEDESFYRQLLSKTRRKKRELPVLKVTYDFTKLPDEISLSREKNIIEYAFYKYKPMLEKANDYIKKRKVRDAINYYKVVMSQNIPPEFKAMIRKNLDDLTEYLEKYLTSD